MRTFAHEKARGTFETLMTTPVSDIQVVLAKFIGSYVFFLIAFLPTVVYPFLLEHYAHERAGGFGRGWSWLWESGCTAPFSWRWAASPRP